MYSVGPNLPQNYVTVHKISITLSRSIGRKIDSLNQGANNESGSAQSAVPVSFEGRQNVFLGDNYFILNEDYDYPVTDLTDEQFGSQMNSISEHIPYALSVLDEEPNSEESLVANCLGSVLCTCDLSCFNENCCVYKSNVGEDFLEDPSEYSQEFVEELNGIITALGVVATMRHERLAHISSVTRKRISKCLVWRYICITKNEDLELEFPGVLNSVCVIRTLMGYESDVCITKRPIRPLVFCECNCENHLLCFAENSMIKRFVKYKRLTQPMKTELKFKLENVIASWSVLGGSYADQNFMLIQKKDFFRKLRSSDIYCILQNFSESILEGCSKLPRHSPLASIPSLIKYVVQIDKNIFDIYGQGTTSSIFNSLFVSDDVEGESVTTYVNNFIKCYWLKIKNMCGFLNDTVLEILEKIFKSLGNYLTTTIFGSLYGGFKMIIFDNLQKSVVSGVSLFCLWLIIKTMGIVTDKIANTIYETCMNRICPGLVGQAPDDPMSLITTVLSVIVGLTGKDLNKVTNFTKRVVGLMAGGTILLNVMKTCLVILPASLRIALVYRFGSNVQRLECDIESWRSVSMSLLAISKIQSVVGSEDYASRIEEQVKEGGNLIRRCTYDVKPSLKQSFMASYAKLVNIHTCLMTKKYNAGDRELPFAFHVSGPPGIGKTTSIKHLLIAACDLQTNDFYYKDGSDDFWSGYQGQRTIVMDEFLCGPPEICYENMVAYLTMVSTSEWRPNFASVDDPNVGIKGNVCRPEIIATLNNIKYDRVDHKIDTAFQRRRKFVIQCDKSEHFKCVVGNTSNVDFNRYTPDECRRRVWMKFSIWPAIHSVGNEPIIKDMTYDDLIVFVRYQYSEHLKLAAIINSQMNSSVSSKSTKDILNEVLRDTYDIPNKPLTVMEAIRNLVNPVGAQGPFSSVCCSESAVALGNVVENEIKTTGDVCTNVTLPDSNEDGCLQQIWNRVTGDAPSFCGAASLVVLLGVACNYLTGRSDSPDTFYGQSERVNKHTKDPKLRPAIRQRGKIHAQGFEVPVVKLTHELPINAIAICDNYFLTYGHGVPELGSSEKPWLVEYKGHKYVCPYVNNNIFDIEGSDLVVIKLECPQMPRFKNIIKYFINFSEMNSINNCQAVVDNGTKCFSSRLTKLPNIHYTVEDHEVCIGDCIRYNAATERGDCGLPVRITSGDLVNKIAGVHVAGTGSCAYDPIGVASIVAQETLYDIVNPVGAQGPNNNLVEERRISWNQRIPIPIHTKFTKSEIASSLPYESVKQPAILSTSDPRSKGLDPIEVSLNRLYAKEEIDVNQDIVDRLERELSCKYINNLKRVRTEPLSFEEACAGVPGLLSSLTISTSPGYPLCHLAKKKGKQDFVWFEGQKLCYTNEFKLLVDRRLEEMRNYNGGVIDHRFLGFLKDELLLMKKIEAVKTRMTFANDLVSLVAFRMEFGCVIIAFMISFEVTGFAMGLNQYSRDMNGIYNYLSVLRRKFGAGDFESYDMNFVSQYEKLAYNVFCLVARSFGVCQNSCNYLVEHETKSAFQIGDKVIKVKCSNKSGCLLTTIINCIINNAYVGSCFYEKYPDSCFEDEVRIVSLGDDHLYTTSENHDLNPLELSNQMKKIGQVYTSAFKDRPLSEEYDNFEDVTFLGAIPRRSSNGLWTGALRKQTLEQTILWTRDKNRTLDATVQQMIDCASQWDKTYFESYVDDLKRSYFNCGRIWNFKSDYESLSEVVARRTAASGKSFTPLVGQGPKVYCGTYKDITGVELKDAYTCKQYAREKKYQLEASKPPVLKREPKFYGYNLMGCLPKKLHGQGLPATGLPPAVGSIIQATGLITTIATPDETPGNTDSANYQESIADLAIPAQLGDLALGTESFVKRYTFVWSNADAAGTTPVTIAMPFGLFSSSTSVQDNGFYQYTYSQPTIELKFMVNGTPFQAGALVAYFSPLTAATAPSLTSAISYEHVVLTPNNNTSVSYFIPYKFFKTWLNNRRGFTDLTQTIGYLYITVLSPLTTGTLPTTATVVVYARLKSKFNLPRPRTLTGQGNSYSVTNNNKIGSIGGDMPNQGGSKGGSQSNEATMKGPMPELPLDNPPISGCTVPIAPMFPSMSKVVGLEPTVSLQLHPTMLSRQPNRIRNRSSTNINDLCARRGYVEDFNLPTSTADGTLVYSFPLNSMLNDTFTPGATNPVPPNIGVLNLFQRWRADMEIEIFCAKTVFHNVRLAITAKYGYHTTGTLLQSESFPTRVLDYTGENQWTSTTIPFNAPTEFLRTYDGPTTYAVDEYSQGIVELRVLNALRASSSVVTQSVDFYVFVRFHNVRVYEPRSDQYIGLCGSEELPTLVGQGSVAEDMTTGMTSDVSNGATVLVDPVIGDDSNSLASVSIVKGRELNDQEKPCLLNEGDKYEYTVKDITELGRRHTAVPYQTLDGYTYQLAIGQIGLGQNSSTVGNWLNSQFISFFVYPVHPVCKLYAAWSGHLKYRIMVTRNSAISSTSLTNVFKIGYVPARDCAYNQTVNPFIGTIPPAAGTLNSLCFDSIPLWEFNTLTGKTASVGTGYNAATYIVKDTNLCTPAVEYSTGTNDSHVWIDVSIPFNVIDHFLPTNPSYYYTNKLSQAYNGRLVIQAPSNIDSNTYNVSVYQAFGDDFNLHCYQPLANSDAAGFRKATYGIPANIVTPTSGVSLGQNVYGDH